MQLQWTPPTAIEALFLQIEDGLSFATSGHDAPTKQTVLRWAYNNIEQTGRFDIACREWRQMNSSAKDWLTFKRHFKAADKDLRRMDITGSAGYTVQHTRCKPLAPCSQPLKPPLPPVNKPSLEP
jgi:hypothetical protein